MRWALKMRKTLPPVGLGAHLRRRYGQSLEFIEYRDYQVGDDIRNVDWQASFRRPHNHPWIARAYEAEQAKPLLIILDCRTAMRLPVRAEKLLVGIWLAQILAQLALRRGDAVTLATMFGRVKTKPLKVKSLAGMAQIQKYLRKIYTETPSDADWGAAPPPLDLSALDKQLRHAAAICVISDFTFDDATNAFANFARRAQGNFRALYMLALDSWPAERALLTAQPFRLASVEASPIYDGLREADAAYLAACDAALATQLTTLRRHCTGPGLVWPDAPLAYRNQPTNDLAALQDWFRQAALNNPTLRSLMTRVA